MNLTEALGGALPDIPVRRKKPTVKLHPRISWHEQTLDGELIIMAYVPGVENLFTFAPDQWQIVQMFDGKRTYGDIAQELNQRLGMPISENDVGELVASLDAQDFWYQSEQNSLAFAKMREERRKRSQHKPSKFGDLSSAIITSWDADRYFTWLADHLGWLYTPGFFLFSLCAYAFTVAIFISYWGEIGRDTLQYYNFTQKSFSDLVEFWILFFVLAFFHESAHGVSCKHYGGGVHKMGILLMYLNIWAFFVDVTESWLYTSRWQRITVLVAGVWVELLICSTGTLVWWVTVPGSFVHELAYKIMLIAGVAVLFINFNPLVKADGYYIFAELIGNTGLKEDSTQYVSAWVQRNIFRLPVEIPFVPRKRRFLFVPYALLSGAYSYLLLYAVSRLAYNIFRSFTPEWAFIPGILVGLAIFKSRIRKLVAFMNTVYLDKKERLAAWLTRPRLAALSVAALVVLFAPLWRETAGGRFLLEPAQRWQVRAEVPGTLTAVFADEGQAVKAGVLLARLENLDLETAAARAKADYRVASAKATEAQLQYADYGSARQEAWRTQERSRGLDDKMARLELRSPIAGTVLTPRVHDRVGSYLAAGTLVAEIADTSLMRASIYLAESDMRNIRVGEEASLRPNGSFRRRIGKVAEIAPVSSEIASGLMEALPYKGLRAGQFYRLVVLLPNADGQLYTGMSGDAKVMIQRRSLAGFLGQAVHDMLGRKVW